MQYTHGRCVKKTGKSGKEELARRQANMEIVEEEVPVVVEGKVPEVAVAVEEVKENAKQEVQDVIAKQLQLKKRFL